MRFWFAPLLISLVLATALTAGAQTFATISEYGIWKTQCRINKMEDKRECRVETEYFDNLQQTMVEVTYDVNNKFIAIIVVPVAVRAAIRIDQNRSLNTHCPSVCYFSKADGRAAHQQLLHGTTMLLSAASTSGTIEPKEFPVAGYRDAVAAAEAWIKGQ